MVRIGFDIIEIPRFEAVVKSYQSRFLQRIFTAQEIAEIGDNIMSLAVRFAGKEAVSKALHTGIGKVRWRDIEILRGQAGEPILHLYAKAKIIAKDAGLSDWSLSLSHTKNYATAAVVAMEKVIPKS